MEEIIPREAPNNTYFSTNEKCSRRLRKDSPGICDGLMLIVYESNRYYCPRCGKFSDEK